MKQIDINQIEVRPASSEDMDDITVIYCREVINGVTSWEKVAPNAAEMNTHRIALQADGFPYFVVHVNNQVVGFTYASSYRARFGYRFTVESSIYVAQNFQRLGLGHFLMTHLIDACSELGFKQMMAVVGDSNNKMSINFHLKMGFDKIATLKSIGLRGDQWLDTVLMKIPLGEANQKPPKN